jgi:hypothetical protein
MFRKLVVAGAMGLLAVAPSMAPALAQQFAPVPTSPSPTSTTAPSSVPATPATTSTTEPATTVQRSTDDFANTGPRDWVGLITLGGVISFALGIALRGKRAPGQFYFDRK